MKWGMRDYGLVQDEVHQNEVPLERRRDPASFLPAGFPYQIHRELCPPTNPAAKRSAVTDEAAATCALASTLLWETLELRSHLL